MSSQMIATWSFASATKPGTLKKTRSGKNITGSKNSSDAAFAGGHRRAIHRAMGTQRKKARMLNMLPGECTWSDHQRC